jgi:four helix bundle protein
VKVGRRRAEGGRKNTAGTTTVSQEVTELKQRTKQFALRIIRLYAALPGTALAQVIGKQLLRCGTSVGAHYREAYRARSTAEYISKVEVGLQELEEAGYWLELLVEGGVLPEDRLANLLDEVDQLTAILVTCVKTAKKARTDTETQGDHTRK